jgi:hypothetical protein
MDLISGSIVKEIEERIASGETFIKAVTAAFDKATHEYENVFNDTKYDTDINSEIDNLRKLRDKLKGDNKETWQNVDNAINDLQASRSIIKDGMQGLDEAMAAYSDSFTFEHPNVYEFTDRPLGGTESDIEAHYQRLANIEDQFYSIRTIKDQANKDSNDKIYNSLATIHDKVATELDLAGTSSIAGSLIREHYNVRLKAYNEFIMGKDEYERQVPVMQKYLAGISENENLKEFRKEEQARKDVVNKAKVEVDKKGLKVMLNRSNTDHDDYNEKIILAKNLLNEEINNTFGTIALEEETIIAASKKKATEEKLGMLDAAAALALTRAHLWSLAEVEKEIREACSRGITSIEVHRSLRLPTLKMLVDLGYNISQSDDKNKFRIIIDWSHAGSGLE